MFGCSSPSTLWLLLLPPKVPITDIVLEFSHRFFLNLDRPYQNSQITAIQQYVLRFAIVHCIRHRNSGAPFGAYLGLYSIMQLGGL